MEISGQTYLTRAGQQALANRIRRERDMELENEQKTVEILKSAPARALAHYVLSKAIAHDGGVAIQWHDSIIPVEDAEEIVAVIEDISKEAVLQTVYRQPLKDLRDLLTLFLDCEECDDMNCPGHPLHEMAKQP